MATHDLKTWPEYFQAIWSGKKKFELRVDDRNFQVGDSLVLHEYDPRTKTYTGRAVWATVTYVLRGGMFGLPKGLCIMSLKDMDNINWRHSHEEGAT